MQLPADHPLAISHALRQPETAVDAIAAVAAIGGRVALEGLAELLLTPTSAEAGNAAVEALRSFDEPLAIDALCDATSAHASVRRAAIEQLQSRCETGATDFVLFCLTTDRSWTVRVAALRFFAAMPEPVRWNVLAAATDPHWRVRHALIQVLHAWSSTEVFSRPSHPTASNTAAEPAGDRSAELPRPAMAA